MEKSAIVFSPLRDNLPDIEERVARKEICVFYDLDFFLIFVTLLYKKLI